ncbi:MAG: hypothetical protein RH862_09960 [Leptospiraceae bacterium]
MRSTESSGFKSIKGRALGLILLAVTALPAAPRVDVSLSYAEFSPDGDGFQDYVWINVRSSESPLYTSDWVLTIRDSDGTIVRQINADRRKIRPSRGVGNLFLPGKYDLQSPVLPSRIYWNGRGRDGKPVRDGNYRLSLQGEFKSGGYINQDYRVRVSTDKPRVTLAATAPVLVRPIASDGSILQPRGEMTIIQRSPAGSGYRFTGQILTPQGDIIEQREWEDRLPASISWNGREPGGSAVDPGNYGYRLIVRDAAGNVRRVEEHGLYVTAGAPDIVLRGNRYYSPQGPTLGLETVSVSGGLSVSGYEFQILDSGGDVVFREGGSSRIPARFTWKGSNDLSEGYYRARVVMDRGGRRVISPEFEFYLDQSGTRPSLSVSSSTFTPDSDFIDDELTMETSFSGPVPVEDWTLSLVIVSESHPELKEVFMAFEGKGLLPSSILWDGTGYQGRELESYETIVPVLSIRNGAGVIRTYEGSTITTGVVLRPIKEGGVELVARFPNRNYFDEEGVINSRGEEVVAAVLSRIDRHQRYFLRVECHSAIAGREEENLERTEEMAYTIFQEFQGNYWPLDRMTYMGAGETEAIYEARGTFENYRNDRMEFRLEDDNFVVKDK